MEKGKNASKTRNWAFLVYPESAPENWQELLADTHISAFISPLHDRDVDENGELKKSHYHVLLTFDGPVMQKQVNQTIEPFNGTKSAERVLSFRGYARYLAHLDENDKVKYNPKEIIALNGADLGVALKLTHSDKYKIIKDILRFCEERNICELSILSKYTENECEEWLPVIVEKAYFISQFLASLRHNNKSG